MINQNKITRYLKQQGKLFGNEIFINQLKNTSLRSGTIFEHKESDDQLLLYKKSISSCLKCSLGNSRDKFVFGTGDPNADLMLIGEAPGQDEDLYGEPFVGRAGKLLNKILAAIGLNRKKGVYITNLLKCRPPNNRDPLKSEIDECEPYLSKQIKLINPKLIVALGKVSGNAILKRDDALKEMREVKHHYLDIPLIVTYHPAALLRNPSFKKEAWRDFRWIKEILRG